MSCLWLYYSCARVRSRMARGDGGMIGLLPIWDWIWFLYLLGVPLLPLYMRGAGLQERFPNWLRVGVLIGYNYISSCTRKIGSYSYTAGSFL